MSFCDRHIKDCRFCHIWVWVSIVNMDFSGPFSWTCRIVLKLSSIGKGSSFLTTGSNQHCLMFSFKRKITFSPYWTSNICSIQKTRKYRWVRKRILVLMPCVSVTRLCPPLCDTVACSLPSCSVHEIL